MTLKRFQQYWEIAYKQFAKEIFHAYFVSTLCLRLYLNKKYLNDHFNCDYIHNYLELEMIANDSLELIYKESM